MATEARQGKARGTNTNQLKLDPRRDSVVCQKGQRGKTNEHPVINLRLTRERLVLAGGAHADSKHLDL